MRKSGRLDVRIDKSVLDDILAHAAEAQPRECCGLLIGSSDRIVEGVRSANLSEDPNRFELDPAVHIQARRSARDRGLAVAGFYHSHPHSPPIPSRTDLAESSYGDAVQLIVGVIDGGFDARLYRYSGSSYETVPLTTND